MSSTTHEAAIYGSQLFDTGLRSLSAATRGAQAIATEAADFAMSSSRSAAEVLEKLGAAASLDTAIQLQSDYARSAYAGLVAEATRITGLYADLARDAYRPFEQIVVTAE